MQISLEDAGLCSSLAPSGASAASSRVAPDVAFEELFARQAGLSGKGALAKTASAAVGAASDGTAANGDSLAEGAAGATDDGSQPMPMAKRADRVAAALLQRMGEHAKLRAKDAKEQSETSTSSPLLSQVRGHHDKSTPDGKAEKRTSMVFAESSSLVAPAATVIPATAVIPVTTVIPVAAAIADPKMVTLPDSVVVTPKSTFAPQPLGLVQATEKSSQPDVDLTAAIKPQGGETSRRESGAGLEAPLRQADLKTFHDAETPNPKIQDIPVQDLPAEAVDQPVPQVLSAHAGLHAAHATGNGHAVDPLASESASPSAKVEPLKTSQSSEPVRVAKADVPLERSSGSMNPGPAVGDHEPAATLSGRKNPPTARSSEHAGNAGVSQQSQVTAGRGAVSTTDAGAETRVPAASTGGAGIENGQSSHHAERVQPANLFTHLDAAQSLPTAQIRATPHEIRLGYRDPSYGWIEIQTRADAGHLTASLQTASDAGHRVLSAELPAMHQYLGERDIAMHSLSVSHSDVQAQGGGGERSSGHAPESQSGHENPVPSRSRAPGGTGVSPEVGEEEGVPMLISVRA